MNKKTLISIVGPTAIGKTKLSIALAKAFNTEILSADSRQFFKEMKIGTAVPFEEELAAAPHHFIQNKSVKEDFSVGDFEKEALQTITEIFQKKDILIMVGGSGLYVKSVLEGLDEFPEVDPEIRKNLNYELQEKGIKSLQKKLKELDPAYFETADVQNPHRIIRALEICLGTGKAFSSYLNKKKEERDFEIISIGLTAPREEIYSRIDKRVGLMMEHGLLGEAKQLYPQHQLNALNTVGYKELFSYLDGDLKLEEAISEIKKNTRRFAKRQLTWFRKDKSIAWFNYKTNPREIIDFIKQQLQATF